MCKEVKAIVIGIILFFALLILAIEISNSAKARAWKQGAMRFIHYNGGCTSGRPVIASWYSSGKHTATGERFNPQGHTAAHKTLPFGTRLTVTNPRNHRSVSVVINDRGPFVKGVTLDLAKGAAQAIGMGGSQYVCI